MQFNIDLGLKSYDVIDADGTLVGTIRFNPADPGMAARWKEMENAVNDVKMWSMDTPEAIKAADDEIKTKLDYAFGSPVSEVFFGKVSSLAICADGRLVLETVLEALAPIVEKSIKEAEKKTKKRMEKYTGAYKNSDAGLAPGQKA